MSRVDFYDLPDGSNSDRFACAIATKAWASGNRVHVHTQSEENATKFDDLLWVYKDISFVPHEIFNANEDNETPVTIGHSNLFPDSSQVMINLGYDVPDFASHFERVIEIVGGNESSKEAARERYRQYKDANYEMHYHKIENLTEHD
ncbi:MAG: DNA polymerase III subunit chi [marine bacterium B5-7]|nr:MAG: DNA polymerase III subunit chi [marine bacterium B5-7]